MKIDYKISLCSSSYLCCRQSSKYTFLKKYHILKPNFDILKGFWIGFQIKPITLEVTHFQQPCMNVKKSTNVYLFKIVLSLSSCKVPISHKTSLRPTHSVMWNTGNSLAVRIVCLSSACHIRDNSSK